MQTPLRCAYNFRMNPINKLFFCSLLATATNEQCLIFVCFKDIDDCVTARCVNGATCVDGVNQYSCTCNVGFTGT